MSAIYPPPFRQPLPGVVSGSPAVIPPERGLVLLTNARRLLAEAKSITEVKSIRDQGHAAIKWAKSRRDIGLEVQNDAAEIVIMAERKLGTMLADLHLHGGDRKTESRLAYPNLNGLGITGFQSCRWQSMAQVPEEQFQLWVEESRTAGKQLTSGAVVKLGKQSHRKDWADSQEPVEGVVGNLNELIGGPKFRCIHADPPWPYGNQGTRAATSNHYRTMTVEEIAAEPVAQVADEVSHLYLWVTASFLPCAFDVMSGWGFTYKTNMVWVKPQMGIGNYVRVSHEHLLVGVKGDTRTRGTKQMSWMQANRTKHSRKPREFREAIERMSDGPYLELYGRERMPGWVVYGDQIETLNRT